MAAMAWTVSIPLATRANAVYFMSSDRHSPMQMKNDVVALPGSSPRAIETMPGTFGVSLNSGARLRTSFCCDGVSGALGTRARRSG